MHLFITKQEIIERLGCTDTVIETGYGFDQERQEVYCYKIFVLRKTNNEDPQINNKMISIDNGRTVKESDERIEQL